MVSRLLNDERKNYNTFKVAVLPRLVKKVTGKSSERVGINLNGCIALVTEVVYNCFGYGRVGKKCVV